MKIMTACMVSLGLLAGSAGIAVAQDKTPPTGVAEPSSPMNAPADQMGRSAAPGAVTPFNASPSARSMTGPSKDAGSTANTRAND